MLMGVLIKDFVVVDTTLFICARLLNAAFLVD